MRPNFGVGMRVGAVVAVHVAILFALAQLHPQLREQTEPLFVSLIELPKPVVAEPPKPVAPAHKQDLPKPRRDAEPVPRAPAAVVEEKPRPSPIPVEPAPMSEVAPTIPPAAAAPEAADAGTGTAGPTSGSGKGSGSAVTAPRFDAAYLNNPRPEYPRIARRNGEQGRVLLNVFVNAGGQAERVEIRTSSGYPRLDQAARDAVHRWKFIPARQGDEPVSAWVVVPVSFVLES